MRYSLPQRCIKERRGGYAPATILFLSWFGEVICLHVSQKSALLNKIGLENNSFSEKTLTSIF